jgi:hypothetical protein
VREFVTVLSYVEAGKTLNEGFRSFVVSASLAVIVAAYNSQWSLCVAWIGVCIVDYLFATDVSQKLARNCDLSASEEDAGIASLVSQSRHPPISCHVSRVIFVSTTPIAMLFFKENAVTPSTNQAINLPTR